MFCFGLAFQLIHNGFFLFPFLLMFLALYDLFVELRAFLPFLTIHTEKAAMIHDFLRVKYLSLIHI